MAQKTLSMNALKGPIRPAPPPPASIKQLSTQLNGHTTNSTVPGGPPRPTTAPKKKPAPPRPPPPKASAQLKAIGNAIAFTGALQQAQQPKQVTQLSLTSSATAPDLLINWDSPPTSPTPGRWSSDALSLRSFGSDSSGTTATGTFSAMTRSESGFESEPDLWSEAGSTGNNSTSKIDDNTKPFTMPTIIRPSRTVKAPVASASASSSTHLKALEKIIPATSSSESCASHSAVDLLDLDASDYSPPEPTIPPPAPPSFLLDSPPDRCVVQESGVPSALALYDYTSPHPGDLNFKEGERIVLVSKVNDEWMRGRAGSAEGMFPASFVRVIVPLDESANGLSPASDTYRAVVLYAFSAETDQDLSVQEGDLLEVTESYGNGWLYGRHCHTGQWGQFPEAFVRREDH